MIKAAETNICNDGFPLANTKYGGARKWKFDNHFHCDVFDCKKEK